MMRRNFVVLLLPLALAGCGTPLPPFETAPPAITSAKDDTLHVALCYNGLTTSEEQLNALALESCGSGMKAQPLGRGINLDHCPVLMPARAIFACTGP